MSIRNLLIIGAVGFVLALVIFFLGDREPQTPEEHVQAVLNDITGAVAERNPGGILSHVSDSFRGDGGLDKDRLRGLIFLEIQRGAWSRVVLYDTRIALQSSTLADVQTRAFLARGDGPLPRNADGWELDLTLEEEKDGKWRIVSGSYRSARRN